MPSLVLTVPHEDGPRKYTLALTHASATEPTASKGGMRFTTTKTLHEDNSFVYRGTLDDFYGRYPVDVVCKLVFGNTAPLESEAKLYASTLEDVQGFIVPVFMGYFAGTCPFSGAPMACILTEYSGKCLRGDWHHLPIQTR